MRSELEQHEAKIAPVLFTARNYLEKMIDSSYQVGLQASPLIKEAIATLVCQFVQEEERCAFFLLYQRPETQPELQNIVQAGARSLLNKTGRTVLHHRPGGALAIAGAICAILIENEHVLPLLFTCLLREQHKKLSKVYEVTKGLSILLSKTSVRGISTKDIQLPFQTLFIQVPSGTFQNQESGNFTGLYVHEEKRHATEINEAYRIWFVYLAAEHTTPTTLEPYDTARLGFAFTLKEDEPIDALKLLRIGNEKDHSLGETILLWLFNLCLYLGGPDADQIFEVTNKEARDLTNRIAKLPKGPKKDKLKDQLKRLEPRDRYIIGRSFKTQEAEATIGKKGGKLLVQTWVAGHHRRVVDVKEPLWETREDGSKINTARRWIWVRPYRKGDEDAPISNPLRIVK